jgi:hypothetical protein
MFFDDTAPHPRFMLVHPVQNLGLSGFEIRINTICIWKSTDGR